MTAQSKDGVGRKGKATAAHRKSAARSRIFRELVHIAAEQGASIELGVSTGDALQECLDRAVAFWRFAAAQVDSILIPEVPVEVTDDETGEVIDVTLTSLSNLHYSEDPFFEVIPNPQGPDIVEQHRWVKMEGEARREIEKLAAMMTQLGIAERVVRVEEAKAALLAAAVRDAALEVGLTHDQVRALGAAIRDRLAPPASNQTNGEGHPHRQERMRVRGTVGPGKPALKASAAVESTLAGEGEAPPPPLTGGSP